MSQLSIKPLSQRDVSWRNILLGFSKTTTLGTHGCTVTGLTMIANYYGYDLTPDVVNEKLKAVNGYANTNLIIWSKIEEALPGLKFEWRGYSYDNEAVKNALPCLVEVDGARIGNSKHWVAYLGNQQMVDPWYGNIKSTTYYPPTGYAIIRFVKESMPDTTDQKVHYYTPGDENEDPSLLRKARNNNWNLYNPLAEMGVKSPKDVNILQDEVKKANDKVLELETSMRNADEDWKLQKAEYDGIITRLKKVKKDDIGAYQKLLESLGEALGTSSAIENIFGQIQAGTEAIDQITTYRADFKDKSSKLNSCLKREKELITKSKQKLGVPISYRLTWLGLIRRIEQLINFKKKRDAGGEKSSG